MYGSDLDGRRGQKIGFGFSLLSQKIKTKKSTTPYYVRWTLFFDHKYFYAEKVYILQPTQTIVIIQDVSKLMLPTSGYCFWVKRNLNYHIIRVQFLFLYRVSGFHYKINIFKRACPNSTKIWLNTLLGRLFNRKKF